MYDNLSKYEFKASFRSWENENWKCSILHNFQQRSGPIWADRVAFSNFLYFSKNKTRWTYCIFFSKIVHQKGLFEKIKKNSIFWCCLGILDICGRAFLISNIWIKTTSTVDDINTHKIVNDWIGQRTGQMKNVVLNITVDNHRATLCSVMFLLCLCFFLLFSSVKFACQLATTFWQASLGYIIYSGMTTCYFPKIK